MNAITKVSFPCCGYLAVPKITSENFNSHGFKCPVCLWKIDTFISSEKDKSTSNHSLALA